MRHFYQLYAEHGINRKEGTTNNKLEMWIYSPQTPRWNNSVMIIPATVKANDLVSKAKDFNEDKYNSVAVSLLTLGMI